jgi:KDO2-lipid IV(A) lauroyltransferase
MGVVGHLPEGLAMSLSGALGWFAGTVLRIRRGNVDEHLSTAFPDRPASWRAAVARESYRHLGRELAVVLRAARPASPSVSASIDFVGFDEVLASVRRGEGAVLLTAHMGNWEVAGAGLAGLGLPIDVVGKGLANRRLEGDLFALREQFGMKVIPIEDAARDGLRSLSEGRVVAMLADQNAHRGGMFLPFFGRLAATHRGPALFALRTGAPVFVGFAVRLPGAPARYRLEAHRLRVHRTDDGDEDVRRLMAGYHRYLEAAIREAPHQYFWQHRRWRTRPPTEGEEPTSRR